MKMPGRAELDALRRAGDRQADDLVEQMARVHGLPALAELLEVLIRWNPVVTKLPAVDPGLPAEMIREVAAFVSAPGCLDDAMPGGVDWARIRRAQTFYSSHQALGLLILGCGSLPACYAMPGIAEVLIGSGKLAVQVTSRLNQTIGFLTTVMAPNSLGTGSTEWPGNLWIRKVRLMHGVMRCLLLADAAEFEHLDDESPAGFFGRFDWSKRSAATPRPIDQAELAFVLLTFSWMVIKGLRILWVGVDKQTAEDHLYAWSVIGHGLGIDASLRPVSVDEAETLFERIRNDWEAGTEAGRLLVSALVVYIIGRLRQGIREMMWPWLLRFLVTYSRRFGSACLESLARTLVRVLAGASTADRLWVPRAPLLHWAAGLSVRAAILLKDHFQSKSGDKGLSRLLGEQFTMGTRRR